MKKQEYYIDIANAFFIYAFDDFFKNRYKKDRMKFIFYKYFIEGIDLGQIASEIKLSNDTVNKKIKKIISIINNNLKTQCEILDYTKNEAAKTNVLTFELKKIKQINDLDFDSEFIKINNKMIKIEHLDISKRAYNFLNLSGIETLGDLMSFSKMELFKLRNCGTKSILELENVLHSYGLKFKD